MFRMPMMPMMRFFLCVLAALACSCRIVAQAAGSASKKLRGDDGAMAPSTVNLPKAPAWPSAYEVSYVISLPYTQPVALRYPVHVWYNESATTLRIQFYNGVDEIYVLPDAQLWIYPRVSVRSCLVINTTVGPTSASTQDAGDLAGMPPPLPDITSWQFAGSAQLPSKPPTYVWQLTLRQFEKVETYNFHVAQSDNHPVHLTMMGVNLLTGSHFDAYDVDFTYFAPLRTSAPFAPPKKLCASAASSSQQLSPSARTAQAAASQLHSLLPGGAVGSPLGGLPRAQPTAGAGTGGKDADTLAAAGNLRYIHAWNTERRQQQQQQVSSRASPVAPADVVTMGPNHFISWTDERWRGSMLGNVPVTPKRHAARLESRRRSLAFLGEMKRLLRDDQLPEAVDWRGTGADGPVKDQASCGSCWTFATTGAMTGAWYLATNVSLSFSEQQIVDCSWEYDVNGCWGGNVEPALSYIFDHGGVAAEGAYPYAGQNGYCRENTTAKVAAFKGYKSVPERDELALMEAVATYGPVAISFDAVHPTFKFYSSGVYYREDCGQDLDHLNHAVTLVGYGTTPDGTDYWLLRNSWSQYWGSGGYFKMARKGNDCGVTLDAVIAVVDDSVAARHATLARARTTTSVASARAATTAVE